MKTKSQPSVPKLRSLAEARIAIENVAPSINGGRFAAKGVTGRQFIVEADVFCDGHDKIDVALQWRQKGLRNWLEHRMLHAGNDRWRGYFLPSELGLHEFRVVAWRDLFAAWQDEVAKKHAADAPISVELIEGKLLLEKTLAEAKALAKSDRLELSNVVAEANDADSEGALFALLMTGHTTDLMRRVGLRTHLTEMQGAVPVWVDRERAVFSAWYELFPRSMSFSEDRHGTFDDVVAHLPYVRDLGFDVLYFPPIHPIGRTNRKGRNNSLVAGPDDPGSPYAIGAREGGHDAIHPELGNVDDFRRLVRAAHEHGLEIALDFAIQCSPDHPWIKEHPEWFDWRPDGSIKFAENPPKKYEDIVNVHFYRDALPSLWVALRDVVLFWVEQGVKIFRVDNPHTKPLPFWEWLIGEVQAKHPDTIFLSEAFTRPKMMKRLAKIGFTQSYTYFTWRVGKAELTEYLTELTSGDMPAVMRPNFFVNTPDINPVPLQTSGRPGYRIRAVLAGSLSPSWGMYNGFEICEGTSVPGREEYLDSEKYQIRVWDFDRPGHIKDDLRLINRLRAQHPALQQLEGLKFYNAWNDHILYYAKFTPDLSDFVLFAVNLDAHHDQGAPIEIPLWEFDLPDEGTIEARDEVTGEDFIWEGKIQHVYLTAHDRPYAIWSLKNPSVIWS
ncbi:MAG TPA: alpha-1,4-glucan--maltose-1-phosphate maltosyltransferase [Alphaproteobacteria bacterium]|nr:alpha-1,4-glucan--maltose-1-phosphate maltosyltransferase [Alphaproteobacteria bacterium]